MWVGTDKGLWKLDRKTDQVESVTLDTKSLEVRSVFVSQTGRLLVGTTHGLFIYQESAFRKVLFGSNALSSINFITGIVEGYKDTFWLTSQGGLIEYNIETGQSKVYTYQDDEKFVSYFSCLALLKEKLYLGTAGSGMLVFDIGKAAFSICPEVENGYIKSIITVNDEIWVGTNGSGIRIISASTGKELSAIEHTSNADAICSNAVYSLLKEDDMLWVGTYMGGLSYTPAHGSFFSVYSYPELFNSYNIQHNVMTPQPYNRLYQLTGVKGFANKYPTEGYALGADQLSASGVQPKVDNLSSHGFLPQAEMDALVEKYQHPILKKYGEIAKEVGGHGGMDFIMDSRLVYCLQNGLPLDMDVYDLAEWCALAELGEISMDNNCAAVEFPDFTRGEWNVVKGYKHAYASPEEEQASMEKAKAFTAKLKERGAKEWATEADK